MADAHANPELTVGTTVGNYRVEQKIGEGGMGAVYLAEHPLLGRKAAVKVLLNEHSRRPDVVTRFFNEAKTAASLRHPALVEVFDFGFLPDGAGYIVMEYLDGESLASRLHRVAPLPPELCAEIGRQLSAGVAAAHEQGIVHRDLKPDNIFLVPDPEQPGRERVKILDFGIAKLVLPNSPGSKGATTTGMLLGTPLYMAPEQCRGSGQVDHRADIYSVGCILYMMLAGRPPFDYEGVGEILAAHLHEPVKSPRTLDPTIPEQLESIVMRALAKKPEDRYQSASELGADLQRFVLGPTGPARPAPSFDPRSSSASGARVAADRLSQSTPVTMPSLHPQPVPPLQPVPAKQPEDDRLPPPGALGGGRAAGLVVALLLVAGAAGGLLYWRLRPGPAAPVAVAPSAPKEPGPPGAPPTATPPAASTPEQPPAVVEDPPAPPPGTEGTATGDSPAIATGAPDAGAAVEEAEGPGGQPPAKGRESRPRPVAARPARITSGERLFDRAMDHRSRGEEADALLAFRAALKADGLHGEKRAEAQRQQLLLRPKFGEVEIESAVDGVKVLVDGRLRGTTPLPAPLLLRPGRHVLTLSHPRYRTVTRTITLAATEKVPVRFEY